jgi:hypothetical protein
MTTAAKKKITCVCLQDCYIRHESPRHTHYYRGEVAEFNACPLNFEPVEQAFSADDTSEEIAFDFSTASEELLLVAEFDVAELIQFAKEKYGVSLPASQSRTKLVSKFVDARHRHVAGANAMVSALDNAINS